MIGEPQGAVIVPAVLGVGLIFSLGALARDVVHRVRGRRWLDRRAMLDGHTSALVATEGERAALADHRSFRSRWAYGVIGLAATMLSVYVALGSWGNFRGLTEWAENVAWAFVILLVLAGAFGVIGVTSLTVWARYKRPPAWTRPLLAHTPLTRFPHVSRPEPAVRDVLVQRFRPLGPHHINDRVAFVARLIAFVWSIAATSTFFFLAIRGHMPQAEGGTTLDAAIAGPIQVGLLVVTMIGAGVAFRSEAAGAALLAVGGVGLAITASIQYPPRVALAVAGVFLVPAFLHWLAWQRDRHLHHIVALLGVTMLLTGVVWVGSERVYARYFGPAHPATTQPALPDSPVDWVWAGGTTSAETTVVGKLRSDQDIVRIALAEQPDFSDARYSDVTSADRSNHQVVRATFSALSPDTTYHYAVEADGELDVVRAGSLHTFPDGASSFAVAFASCARTGSNGSVFDAIREQQPLAYLAVGDINYANISTNDQNLFRDALDRTLRATSQSALYRSTSVGYVWDDHDYAANDANETARTRPAAEAVYRQYVPHYPLTGDATSGPIYQAFTIGRVRFLLTDTRSTRTPQSAPDDASKFMLGPEQEKWLVDELAAARDRDGIVVWVNPDPWIAAPSPGGDSWSGYTTQRARLADVVASYGLADRLVMLSGDAHMVALDDGTNSDYSSSGGTGFPVLHGAALDRPGGVKGGPYSDGTFPGAGQFGMIDVADTGGDTIEVTLSGHTWDQRTLVERSFVLRSRTGTGS